LKKWIVSAVALVVLCLGFSVANGHFTEPVAVKTVPVEKGAISTFVAAPGHVINRDELMVSSPVAGQIAQIHVREGEEVRKGQVLASFDAQLSTLQVEKSRTALALAAQKLSEAERDALSTRRIFEAGGEARSAVQAAQSRAQSARQELQLARADWQQARLQLGLTHITSASAGTVVANPARAGMWVKAGDPVFRVVPLGAREVEAKIDAADSASVVVGKSVGMTSDAFVGRQWREKITWVAPYTNKETTSNSLTVRMSLGPEAPALVLGQQVDVKITTASKDQVVKIPSGAIIALQGQPMVALIKQGRVHFSPVSIGMGDATHTEVTSGLEAGNHIILTEGKTLREGDKVTSSAKPSST
jgi:membrane fusion protein, multidrug efflux system